MFAVKVGSLLCSLVYFIVCKAIDGTHLLRKLISELGEFKINMACITEQNFIPVLSPIVKKPCYLNYLKFSLLNRNFL